MALLKPHSLQLPVAPEAVRALAVGTPVLLSGLVHTGRDRFHKYVADGGPLPEGLKILALYHCGPVVVGTAPDWRVCAAGPTTSIREEPYMARVIERCGVRVIIGKGGMGPSTQAACVRFGAVYLQATGGAAQVLARTIVAVRSVHFLERFGAAEAVWEFEMRDFPAVVTLDAAGENLHARIEASSRERLRVLRGKPDDQGRGRSA
jgi:fumarate hydratase class I